MGSNQGTALLPCRLGAGVHPAGSDRAPLPGCPCHLSQAEAAPDGDPSSQLSTYCHTLGLLWPHSLYAPRHPEGCSNRSDAVPGECLRWGGWLPATVGRSALDLAKLSGQVWEPGSSMARRSSESSALLHQQPSRAALPNGTTEPSVPSTAHSPAPPLSSPQRCALLQGSQLYAVINAVPVRRWKEFMRVLELRDTEIELVEMEVAPFRDRQYEMLKRWCQQTSATLDRIFAALEHMDLSGCAETLRQSLALGP